LIWEKDDAGLNIREYPYLNRETLTVDFPAMRATLEGARAGDVVLLQAHISEHDNESEPLSRSLYIMTIRQKQLFGEHNE